MRHDRIHDRLPDRALVELRVANHGDLPSALRHVKTPGDVAMAIALQTGAVAPMPTQPVEKSAGIGSLMRLG